MKTEIKRAVMVFMLGGMFACAHSATSRTEKPKEGMQCACCEADKCACECCGGKHEGKGEGCCT